MPILRLFLWMCFSQRFINKHLPNDWMAGCWLIFWGCLFATVASAGIIAFAETNLQLFTYGAM
jgi:hypothetical protein